jgi:hypothetical protein
MRTLAFPLGQDLVKLIAEIDEFKGRWEALKTLSPDRLNALRKVAIVESVGSSTRIEGAKLTDAQVETLLSNIKIQSFATPDEQEVAGYAEAMDLGRRNHNGQILEAFPSICRLWPFVSSTRQQSYETPPKKALALNPSKCNKAYRVFCVHPVGSSAASKARLLLVFAPAARVGRKRFRPTSLVFQKGSARRFRRCKKRNSDHLGGVMLAVPRSTAGFLRQYFCGA